MCRVQVRKVDTQGGVYEIYGLPTVCTTALIESKINLIATE